MTHTCEKCQRTFPIERHEKMIINHRIVLLMHTGKNMVYKGDMNREYAFCPHCGTIENQWSAEARDQFVP